MAKFIIRSAVSDVTNPGAQKRQRGGGGAPGGAMCPGTEHRPCRCGTQARARAPRGVPDRPAPAALAAARPIRHRTETLSVANHVERPGRVVQRAVQQKRGETRHDAVAVGPGALARNWAKTFAVVASAGSAPVARSSSTRGRRKAEERRHRYARRPEAPCARCRLKETRSNQPPHLFGGPVPCTARGQHAGPGRDRHKRRSGSRARGAVTGRSKAR